MDDLNHNILLKGYQDEIYLILIILARHIENLCLNLSTCASRSFIWQE